MSDYKAGGAEFVLNGDISASQGNIAALTSGGFIVTWFGSGGEGDSDGESVRAQLLDAFGRKIGSEFLVNTTTPGSQRTPDVAGLSSGGFVITWTEITNADAQIKAQVFDAAGNKLGLEFEVNTTVAGSQISSRVTALPSGGFVITWTDRNSGGEIKAQLFDSSGTKIGGEISVNTETQFTQELPVVEALSSGGFVVAWDSYDSTDFFTRKAITRAQIFDAEGESNFS